MKTTTKLSIRWLATLPLLGFAAGASGFVACTAEFKTRCPDGTFQNGGGDVNDPNVCKPVDEHGGSAGTSAGGGGQGGGNSVGGEGGGQAPVCTAGATRCANDAQETCGEGGQWGPAKACDIGCDAAGSKCIVPVQVAVAGASACALLSDGTARCWGSNTSGALGNGTDAGSLKPTPVVGVSNAAKIVAGLGGACVINHDKSAACWGANGKGQLAENPNGTNNAIKAPLVLGFAEVRDIAVGPDNICVVSGTTGASIVQCRGSNGSGQLGNGTTTPSSKFETVKGLPASIRGVGVGASHACAVNEQGATFCWGEGKSGQNGNPALTMVTEAIPVGGNASSGVLQLSLGYSISFAVREDGALLIWGVFSGTEPIGFGEEYQAKVLDIGAKGLGAFVQHLQACVASDEGSIWCWGYSFNGQTGVHCPEDESCYGPYVQTPRRFDVDWRAVQLSVGGSGGCALTNASEIYCWGQNDAGQVGVGYTSDFEPPSKVIWK